jgi:hypothetical protein
MNQPTIKRTLPPGLRDALRGAAQEELLPTMAALPRRDRDELRTLARQMLNLLDRSESWRPDILPQRIYFAVDDSKQAAAALTHLSDLGCDRYAPMATSDIAMIFVSRRGEYTFLFNGDDLERHRGELARSSDWQKVTYDDIMRCTHLEDLKGLNPTRTQRPAGT